jgi:hypothetical protein
MKIFLDDFMVYSNMVNHLMKLRLCFQKCKEYKLVLTQRMCRYDIFRTHFKVHNFQKKKNTKPQKGSSNSEYASTYKPIVDSGLYSMA